MASGTSAGKEKPGQALDARLFFGWPKETAAGEDGRSASAGAEQRSAGVGVLSDCLFLGWPKDAAGLRRSVPVAPPAAAAVARRLLGRPLGSYVVWPVLFVIAGTSGTSTPAGVWHGIWQALYRCFSGAVDHSQLRRAERHTRCTSRGNAGGRALITYIRRTWDHALRTADTRRRVRRPRLDPRDWLGTSDSFLGHAVRIAKRGDVWHGTRGLRRAWPLADNLRTVDTHSSDTTYLVSTSLALVGRTVDRLYRPGIATLVCFWRGTRLQ